MTRHGRLPSSEEADLMILQRQPMFLTAPTAWLLDYLTPDVKAANQMVSSLAHAPHLTRPPCLNMTALQAGNAVHTYLEVEQAEHEGNTSLALEMAC